MEAMAFPIPTHLPRRAPAQDVSSKVLNKIDAATNKTLDSKLAASWVKELDEEIHTAKERLLERIQSDRPEFERQLATSKSVQSRLETLTDNVEALTQSVLDPKVGHIPKLVTNLSQHRALAQESQDARAKLDALAHLLKCRNSLSALEKLISDGKLDDAKRTSVDLEALLQQTPAYLKKAKAVVDIQRRFMAAQARNEEQLSEAFTRGIVITHNELAVFPSVQIRQSATTISLDSIVSSLSSGSLNNHLTTLRRDVISHFIDHLFKEPTSITHNSAGFIEHRFSHIPAPPGESNPITRIENVASALSFLEKYVFSILPTDQKTTFPRTLVKPTTSSLLNNLLIPSLPTSFAGLSGFLQVTHEALKFEENSIIGILGADATDRPIKTWVDGLVGHYERQRRKLILENSRSIITSSAVGDATFTVEVEISTTVNPDIIPEQGEDSFGFLQATKEEQTPEPSPFKDDAWGFDDDVKDKDIEGTGAVEEDSWGFDDDVPLSPTSPVTKTAPISPSKTTSTNSTSSPEIVTREPEVDSEDAWGWNDEEEPTPEAEPEPEPAAVAVSEPEETAWDDPWDNDSSAPPPEVEDKPVPVIPVVSSPPPKAATRLEKAANKNKKAANGSVNGSISSLRSATASPAPSFQSPTPPTQPVSSPQPTQTQAKPAQLPAIANAGKRPAQLVPIKHTEHYAVSERTKQVVQLVEDILTEGREFASSHLFSTVTTGSTIILSAPSTVDLYRALWPVVNSKRLEAPEKGLMFSNDCTYLANEIERIVRQLPSDLDSATKVKERLEECTKSVKVLGESWWHNVIKTQQEEIDALLEKGCQGFTYTGDQDRYDECEAAINQVLQRIRRSSPKLKKILTKSKYYTAIGLFVNAALDKMLSDILALPDIPELESHRLSELCRIFNALEGLFVEDPEQPSFVVAYVPSWLKFSYLSELLEATMADITYLFETGALVDFSIDELVRLVKALFSDNPRRTDTIHKLMSGHPGQS